MVWFLAGKELFWKGGNWVDLIWSQQGTAVHFRSDSDSAEKVEKVGKVEKVESKSLQHPPISCSHHSGLSSYSNLPDPKEFERSKSIVKSVKSVKIVCKNCTFCINNLWYFETNIETKLVQFCWEEWCFEGLPGKIGDRHVMMSGVPDSPICSRSCNVSKLSSPAWWGDESFFYWRDDFFIGQMRRWELIMTSVTGNCIKISSAA